MGWKTGFWSKNLKPWFLNHHNGWKLGKIKQQFVLFCFQMKLGWTSYHLPCMQQKKGPKRTSQNKIGQTNWLDLLGSITLNLLFFFSFVFLDQCVFYIFFSKLLFLFLFKSILILYFILFEEPLLNYSFFIFILFVFDIWRDFSYSSIFSSIFWVGKCYFFI